MILEPTDSFWRSSASASRRILGRRGMFWLLSTIGTGLGLVLVEYSVSVFLQFFFVKLGVVKASHLPHWLRGWAESASLSAALLVLVGIGVVRAVAFFLAEWSAGMVQEVSCVRMRLVALHRLLLTSSKQTALDASESSYLMGEVIPKVSLLYYHVANCVVFATTIGMLSLCMLWVMPYEAVVGLVGLVCIGILVLLFHRAIRRRAAAMPLHYQTLQRGIERVARNRLFVRISRTENMEYQNLGHNVRGYYSSALQSIFFSALSGNLAPFLGILLLCLLIFISQSMFHSPGVALLALLYLFVRYIQQIRLFTLHYNQLGQFWPRFHDAVRLVSEVPSQELEEAFAISDQLSIWGESRTPELSPAEVLGKSDSSEAPKLEVANLTFRYDASSPLLFEELSFSLEAGEQLGIVGRSGTGKSTLLALLLGLYFPEHGSILWNGVPAGQFFKDNASSVGYVGPEPFLCHGSLRVNLCYGLNYQVSDDKLWKALELSQLAETVSRLEGTLGYVLEEDGTGLSAGEKQRLALARALLRQPSVLILDEATSNLDAQTEADIVDVIRSLRGVCTTIVVSHRPLILDVVSQTIELGSEEGKVHNKRKSQTKS